MKWSERCGLVLALIALVSGAQPAESQDDVAAVATQTAQQPMVQQPGAGDAAAQDPAAQPPAEPPGIFEVATRARILADSAARAERTIERLAATDALAAEIEAAAQRHGELQALLSSIVEMEFIRLERLSRLRDQALVEDDRLEDLQARLMDRLSQLGTMRARWADHQQRWRAWRAELRLDPGFGAVEPELLEAVERIDSVVEQASAAATNVLALQRRTEELRGEIEQIGTIVAAIREGRRRALLDRSEPVMMSSEHRSQLVVWDWREWDPTAAIDPRAYLAFGRANVGFLLFHVLLAIGLALVARRLRGWARGHERWGGLLDHPWALGVLGAVTLAIQRITLAPPLWDVLLWALFGLCAVLLSRGLFATRALRWTVMLLAAFYPAFLLLEVAQLPTPVFRLGLAAVAAAALPTFLVLGRARVRAAAAEDSTDPRRIWPLRIGATMWGVVLLAVVLGYDAFGRWILHASVTSAAVAFVVVLVFALMRVALPMLLEVAETGRRLRGAGVKVMQRMIVLLRIALLAIATLLVLDVWGVGESPGATWRMVMGAGFMLGPLHVTVGRIILAALVVYLAFLVSGVVRTLVTADVQRRQAGDRGLGESISRLVHYGVITIGVVMALAALGVELQNFAIVAGALGIGVGFGLQNVVNNFASGLILLFERPVRVGDTVVVNGEWGTIQKIGLRSTVMVTFDQSEMIVPNADLVSEKVTNWTLSNPTARVIMPVGVAYGSSIADVLKVMTDSAFAHEAVLREPPPEALFVGFGDSSLDFELRVWVNNIRLRLQVRSLVLADVERRLAELGIEIPFPQRDLHLRSIDDAALARWRDEA